MTSTLHDNYNSDRIVFPSFDELPPVPGQPQGSLWNFFDKDGKKDELGTLNILTPSVVRETSEEIQLGYHVQLDWPLDRLEFPGLGRQKTTHSVKDMRPEGFEGLDDEIFMNTQISSQWDSLKHWSIQKQGLFYNGLDMKEALESPRNGIHNICDRGGIVGRGILVDWLRWWEIHNSGKTPPSPIQSYAISVSEIEQVLKWQGTETKQGDIFIIRTGYVRWYEQADTATRRHGTQEQNCAIGVANTIETVHWLYDKHFSAVASDTLSFESWPYPEACCLHEWLLCQWGTPIGELWDLEQLSRKCASLGKWSFFLTSAPLHIKGGIGSPPGAIAIF
ncbi:hypothetical protein N7517_000160 [Penicillium concentricum]|uniref:Cyclase n=1 Tax=Penicillium concentricum TaxID=293559 RepID=A0A9W9SRN6_9EURO|nr:uncharacterized protein N7517_000160 [Penicillium concentricum]KAJ5382249.1 hypothetical protein N7517_000160 [Penicillium concentricum]